MTSSEVSVLSRRTGAFLIVAAAGRLGVGVFPVGVILLLTTRGDLATAGAAVAAFALTAAVAGPVRARWVDNFGALRPMLVFSLAFCAASLLVVPATDTAAWAVIALAALCGATVPPFAAVVQRHLATTLDGPTKQAAFSLDASLSTAANLAAPVGAAGVVTTHPSLVLAVPAGLVLISSLALLPFLDPAARTRTGSLSVRLRALWVRENTHAFTRIVVVAALVGAISGALEIAIPGLSQDVGHLGWAGWLLAAMLASSAVASAAYGLRASSAPIYRRLPALTVGLFAVTLSLLFTPLFTQPLLLLIGPLLVIGALTGLITLGLLLRADSTSSTDEKAVAMSWMGTANNVGTAVGASVAGLLYERLGFTWTSALTVVLSAAAIPVIRPSVK